MHSIYLYVIVGSDLQLVGVFSFLHFRVRTKIFEAKKIQSEINRSSSEEFLRKNKPTSRRCCFERYKIKFSQLNCMETYITERENSK